MSVVDITVEKLKERIKQWHYAPGQRLIESDLERDLNVGRSTVREALRRLAGDGFVVHQPNRGTIVRALSREDVLHIYSVREVIEGLAASLAARNIERGNNRRRLEDIRRKISKAVVEEDIAAYMDLNEQLHNLIIEISENPWLSSISEKLWLPIFRIQFNRFIKKKTKKTSIDEHQQIIQALLDGDSARSEKFMRAHIRSSQKAFSEVPENGMLPG